MIICPAQDRAIQMKGAALPINPSKSPLIQKAYNRGNLAR